VQRKGKTSTPWKKVKPLAEHLHTPQESAQVKGTYLLDDELRDPVPDFDAEVGLGKVGKNNAHLAAVIGVDYTCHGVDAVLSGEPRARGYTAICMSVLAFIVLLLTYMLVLDS